MLITQLLLLTAIAGAAPDVDVQTADQQAIHGTLSALGEDGLVVRVGEADQQIPLKSLVSVSLPGSSALNPEKHNTLVELIDGSVLAGTDYQVKRGTARVTLVGGAKAELPTRSIRSVRFRVAGERDEKADKQWSEILATKAAADFLVIRKKGSLDYLEGILQDLDAEGLTFELDKEPMNVKRPKIEGLVYYKAAGDPLAESFCNITALGGTHLSAKTVRRLPDGQWEIKTPAGVILQLPSDQVSQLDFVSDRFRYLSDLEPETADFTPFLPLKEPLAVLNDFYKPRRDIGLEQAPLKLDGKTYLKGLAAHSRSTLKYRLPAEFKRFTTLVGIDDSVRDSGNARLEIKGDGKSLWQGTVKGTEPSQSLDLDISGVRRLEIVVDFGEDLDIADCVDLCEAKVTK